MIAFDVVFAEPDRSSTPPLRPTPSAASTRRPAPSCKALPSNDQVFADAIGHSRVVLGQIRPARRHRSARGQDAAGDRASRCWARSRRASASISRACCATFRSWSMPLPGAACSRSARARRHRAAGADRHAGRRARPCPRSRFEMLRVVTGSRRDPDQARRGRHARASALQGFEIPTDQQRPALGSFRPQRRVALCLRRRTCWRADVPPPCRAASWSWSAPRRSGCSTSRPRRSIAAMPGVEVHAQLLESMLTERVTDVSELRHRSRSSRLRCSSVSRSSRLRRCLAPGPLFWVGGVVGDAAGRTVLVLFRADRSADRLHLSADRELADLSHARLHQLSARARGAAADPLRLRPVSLAGAGRAARAVAGEARARRRGAGDDGAVLATCAASPRSPRATRTIRRA